MNPIKSLDQSFWLFLYSLLMIPMSFCGCSNDISTNKMFTFSDPLTTPSDSTVKYFPEKDNSKDAFFNKNAFTPFVERWYSQMLYGLHEPVLYNYQGNHDVYRFTWLRAFDNPLSFRIEKKDNLMLLFVKRSSGEGGYTPDKIMLDTTISVTQDDWNTFTEKIDKIGFWKLPLEIDDLGVDGAEWVLEGFCNKQYHVVTRFSPSEKRSFDYKDCCEYLLSLSSIKIPEREIY